MGRIVHKGPTNIKECINGTLLEAGKEIVMPFKDIPKYIIENSNYEVFNDEGELVVEIKKVENSKEVEVPRMGTMRIGSEGLEKKKSKKKKIKEDKV